ncbi:hypothetical protein ACH5RR_016274 [Cinchona calisaya]|uniref:MLO-like protein n=1 Tax=Cinchona calisaya TaxID=153742 RepID=A0ABD2ZYW4_9GENT
MAGGGSDGRSLENTPTWAFAVLCFLLVAVSIIIELLIHLVGSWFKKKRKRSLYEALEKIKAELMLLGFISLILTVVQDHISKICIPKSPGRSWHPCGKNDELDDEEYEDPCEAKGKMQFVSGNGLNQLHIFIFVLAVSHVLYCIMTLGLGTLKMRKWKSWEVETKTIEYQYYNDPERFRFVRDTSFGRRHMNFWSKSSILLWIVCFFRQFFASVAKVDYMTLRHGFIIAHLATRSHGSFDFQKYTSRSLEEDFKVVVGISPIIWLFAMLFLLSNTHGWYSYFWLPFIPLLIILLVGAKLHVIITKMGLRIQERGDIIRGTPVVEPGDHLFWFNRPRLLLFLIHFVLFQNAFQLAFFAWSWYEFGIPSCFHKGPVDISIRLSMGIITQVLCSYVTLPLYALVTQMGSNFKPVIFNEKVASALRSWYNTARKHIKENSRISENATPFSSRRPTPLQGTSPLHLLQGYQNSIVVNDSLRTSPTRPSNFDTEAEGSPSSPHNIDDDDSDSSERIKKDHIDADNVMQEPPSTLRISFPSQRPTRAQHEINISLTDFSFNER